MIETRNLNNEKVTIEELYYKKGRDEEREKILMMCKMLLEDLAIKLRYDEK